MAEGQVGSGSQNPYERIGVIFFDGEKQLRYDKGNRFRDRITRDDPPCWMAGTTVTWPKDLDISETVDGDNITVTTLEVPDGNGGKVKILADKLPDGSTEYHPLIQFFNEIMAGIVRDGMTEDLDNLRGPTSAGRLWQYLMRKYVREDDQEFNEFLEILHEGQKGDNLRPS